MNATTFDMCISAQHPALAGHFPGNPVVPGAMLLSLLMQALAQAPGLFARLGPSPQVIHISQVKFLAPVRPGELLHWVISPTATGLGFEARCAGRAVVRGRLSATDAA